MSQRFKRTLFLDKEAVQNGIGTKGTSVVRVYFNLKTFNPSRVIYELEKLIATEEGLSP